MTARTIHMVVPGALEQKTGGYVYDAQVVGGLTARGWRTTVHELAGTFPDADGVAARSLDQVLSDIPSETRVVVDGLAMGALPEPIRAAGGRLSILSLVHHLLADETGIPAALSTRYRRLETEALAACAGAIVTSPFTASRLRDCELSPSRIRCVPPGVDSRPAARGPGPGSPPGILCVASLIPRKGQDVLVRALARLRDRDWSCVCVGSVSRSPAYAAAVRALVGELGLTGRVRMTGEVDQRALEAAYDTSTFFVLPSHFEGYGMVLTEALARGLPVISTTGGAIPGTVPSDAGLLVAPGDDAALSEAIDAMLDPGRLATMSAAAHARAATLPSWDDAMGVFERAVLELTPPGMGCV